MIFGTNSNYMLKYQKAKAKLVEYDIPQKDYPKFPLNSNELSYPVIYILSRYAESIIENDETGKAEFAPYMVKASQYFDASVGANDRTAYDADFLLSGAAAYFLSNDFGSSKVLCAALFEKIKDMPTTGTSQIILRNLLGYLLLDKVFPISSDTFGGEELCRALLFYYTNGKGLSNIEHAIRKYRTAIYKNNDPMEIYYVDILLAVITITILALPLLVHGLIGRLCFKESFVSVSGNLYTVLAVVVSLFAMCLLPFFFALLFRDIGKTLAVPMVLFFLMIFLMNGDQALFISRILPMGQLRLIALQQFTPSMVQFVFTDFLWIFILYFGAYLGFKHSDLK